MATPDLSTWLRKERVAELLGVQVKTVERMAQAGKFEAAPYKDPAGGPVRTVYHPDDVARIAAARLPGAAPFVLPATPARNGNGNGHGPASAGLERVAPVDELGELPRLAALVAAVVQLSRMSETSPTSPTPAPLWLTLPATAAIAGLSERLLLRAIRDGELHAQREPRSVWTATDRGWRIRRADLEAFV